MIAGISSQEAPDMTSATRQHRRFLFTIIAGALALGVAAGPAFAIDPTGKKTPDETTKKAEDKNPVRKVSAMMKKVSDLMKQLKTGDLTQEEQKKVLKELDRLIALAQQHQQQQPQQQNPQQQQQKQKNRKPQQQPQNSQQQKSSQPMRDERDVLGRVRQGLGPDAPDLGEMWGRLPDQQRDEIMQLLSEKLPLKYKQLLYLYYKSLSEEP
jgi:cell division protein FtsN